MALPIPESDHLAFTQAILSAYSREDALASMLFLRAGGRRLQQVVAPGPLNTLVPSLIIASLDEGWFEDLEAGVHDDRPANPKVKAYFANRRRLVETATLSAPELERRIRLDLPFLDPIEFATGMLRCVRSVCRVDVDGQAQGTGFLVAPDLVLTNQHVLAPMLPSVSGEHDRIICWFDRTESGHKREAGCVEDWLVDSSPPSDLDTQPQAQRGNREPGPDRLDYALIRLAKPVGDDTKDGVKRGYLVPKVKSQAFKIDAPLHILQHPSGNDLAYRGDTKAIISINAQRTRVRYRTNTEGGSSGSPCFDEDWNLVALHHSGEKEYQAAEWNEGVPIDTVFDNMSVAAKDAIRLSRNPPPPGGR